MRLHQYLKSRRIDKDLMSFEVAKRLGISREEYMRIESGLALPSRFQFERLIDILDMDESIYIKVLKEEIAFRHKHTQIG